MHVNPFGANDTKQGANDMFLRLNAIEMDTNL